MNCFKITVLLCFFIAKSQAQIPFSRLSDWQQAGKSTHISYADTLFFDDLLKISATTDAAMNLALTQASEKPTLIIFGKNTYEFARTWAMPSGTAIAGQGAYATRIRFNLGGYGNCIEAKGTVETDFHLLSTNAFFKDDAIITDNDLAAGEYLLLSNKTDDYSFSDWAKGWVCQLNRIKTANNASFTLDEQLRLDLLTAKGAYYKKVTPVSDIVIKNMQIERLDSTAQQTSVISLDFARNALIENVSFTMSNFAHVAINSSYHCVVRGCSFTKAFDYGGGGKGYGVVLQFGSSSCLVENNIFDHLRHAVLLQAGANGNVIAYNYCREPYWTETQLPQGTSGDLVLHGNYPFSNLFEGNICQNIVIDDSHGINGPNNTFFRNRAEYFGIFMNNNPASPSQNFIANEITGNGKLKAGFLSVDLGNYFLQGDNHYEQFNITPKGIFPAGSTPPAENSLYLKNAPEWYTGTQWPFCGNWTQLNKFYNPAYIRYFQGAFLTADAPLLPEKPRLNMLQEGQGITFFWRGDSLRTTLNFNMQIANESGRFLNLFTLSPGNIRATSSHFFQYLSPLKSGEYLFRIEQELSDGTSNISEAVPLYIEPANYNLASPNPFTTKLWLLQKGKYLLYNLHGELMKEFECIHHNQIVETDDLPAGVYLLRQGLVVQKLIRQ